MLELQEAKRALDLDDFTNVKKNIANIQEFSIDHQPINKGRRMCLDDDDDYVPGSGIEDLIDIRNYNLIINGRTIDSCRWWD